MQLRTSDKKTIKEFKKEGVEPSILYYNTGNRSIRYIETNAQLSDSFPAILFIHGAPGSSDSFYEYLYNDSLLKYFKMASVDRPGYGYSGFGDSEPSILNQSILLFPLVEKLVKVSSRLIVVSHSYGGPIAAKIAMDHPQLVDVLVFLAPAIDPTHEKMFWISYLGKVPPTRWITPAAFKVATDEKFGHVAALEEIEHDWDKITSKVVYMQGEKDMLVPFENYYYAAEKMNHLNIDTVRFKEENHFIPWTQKEVIIEKLLEYK